MRPARGLRRFCHGCTVKRDRATAKAHYERNKPATKRTITWTDDLKNQAIKLKHEGLSCAEIGKQLGGFTRNAVIGVLHRLGVSVPRHKYTADDYERARIAKNRRNIERQREKRRANPYPHREANRRWREANKHKLKARRKPYIPLSPEERKLSTILPEYPASLNRTIIEVTGCRFMPGEGFLCCGQPKREDSSYCEHHHAVCHAQP